MLHQASLPDALESRGISRRDFISFCSAVLATLALPQRYLGQVADALTKTTRPIVVWLEFQDCAGNTADHRALELVSRRHGSDYGACRTTNRSVTLGVLYARRSARRGRVSP